MLERGWIRERDLARLLAEQEKLDFVDLAKIDLDQNARGLRTGVDRASREGDPVRLRQLGAPHRRRRPHGRPRARRDPRGGRPTYPLRVALQARVESALCDAFGDPLVASA